MADHVTLVDMVPVIDRKRNKCVNRVAPEQHPSEGGKQKRTTYARILGTALGGLLSLESPCVGFAVASLSDDDQDGSAIK